MKVAFFVDIKSFVSIDDSIETIHQILEYGMNRMIHNE